MREARSSRTRDSFSARHYYRGFTDEPSPSDPSWSRSSRLGSLGAGKGLGTSTMEEEESRMPKQDLRGQRFGRLFVRREAGRTSRQDVIWECQCSCGEVVSVTTNSLKSGRKKSCRCLERENRRKNLLGGGRRSHGLSDTREYKSWASMLQRCRNPKDPSFSLYGERGIRVCNEWLDFSNFLADMGERPEGTSLDRVDPNGDYTPENCRWATCSEQIANRRRYRPVSRRDEEILLLFKRPLVFLYREEPVCGSQ